MAKSSKPLSPAARKPNGAIGKLNVPSSFMQSVTGNVELEGGFGVNSPYVQFVHKQAKNYAKLTKQLKGVSDDDIVLVYPGNELPVRLTPFIFSPINLYQYWATLDASGVPTKVYWSLEEAAANSTEHVDSMVIVYLEDRAVIARAVFKSTKVKAIRTANAAIAEASDELEWAAKGNDYKNTLTIEQPYFRFMAEVELTRKVSKSNGNPYYLATSTINPTTSNEWKKLFELFAQDDFEEQMKVVTDDFNARRKYLEDKK